MFGLSTAGPATDSSGTTQLLFGRSSPRTDFDGDAAPDLIFGTSNPGSTSGPALLVGDGAGGSSTNWRPLPAPSASCAPVIIQTANVGGPALPDVVLLLADGKSVRSSTTIRACASRGTTPATPPRRDPTVTGSPPTGTRTATSTATFTVDGDADADSDRRLRSLRWPDWRQQPRRHRRHGDLDGDELPDLAVSDAAAGVVRIIYNPAHA
ncbi:MAG: hypothetical protein U0802_14560 [Candidatus Binatia bacterium]